MLFLNEERPVNQPSLKSLHPNSSLSDAKLEAYRNISTPGLIDSLKPGAPGALKVREDGTIMDGHHRVRVLRERDVAVDALPREIVTKNGENGWS
jgi:hypothetical protein